MTQCVNPSSATALAQGLEALIYPVVEDCDKHVEQVLSSQASLSQNIDRLTRILGKLLENTPEPLAAAHATKLVNIRQRVTSLGSTVSAVQARLARLHQMKSQLPRTTQTSVAVTSADQTDEPASTE
mmetsp:Transcript_41298/g.78957  ORF Transcript_41298/g.78957 Transcript_41298/m.78957 type:complete len:127 (+) Transcript_41298:178-558(+)|eukprot:CAMPEP_0114246150 /NCGR_PEP_ID=MMETSP0058-20121206/12295_1 /TAXON_ID=36894 /ORGANISM="Pyramimonas parkeae, CCMP726" /LENGTH=126 /DNA_ID=CAMNT_0001359289 /DNA_START=395 /DNA_END=775 /DNA_ORIENTATION=+